MMRLILLLTIVCLGSFYSNEIPAQVDESRKKIGLVLSGGGARGAAHIGVLKVLEELEVPIDFISGTSMGAIIGGLYAAGYTADQIEVILKEIDWDVALADEPARKNRTMRTKEIEAEFPIPVRVGFNGGRLQLPLGAIAGQHLDQIFQRVLLPVSHIRDFDDLSIPFRAVATDLESGEQIVLRDGSLANAVRASMSVPGVFAPVRRDGRLLVDGGMANNLPVSVARDMGADIIIAVDISTPLMTEDELRTVLDVTSQLTGFLTRRNSERSIASLGPQDLLIVPQLGDFSSGDFQDAPSVIGIGREAAVGKSAELSEIARIARTGREGNQRYALEPPPQEVIAFIELDNESVLDDELVLSRLGVKAGDPLDIDLLDKGVDNVYALDVFTSVTYDFVLNEAGERGVRINALPRRWGPNYLQFGLELSSNSAGGDDFLLDMAYTRNAMNRLGGELRVVASVGRTDEISANLYQPIDFRANWFIEPEIGYRSTSYSLWREDEQVAEYDVDGWGGHLALGRNIGNSNQFRVAYVGATGDASLRIGVPVVPVREDVDIGEIVPEFRHDSLDRPSFPRRGNLHRVLYRWSRESLGASLDFGQVAANGLAAWTRGRNTLVVNYLAGYSSDDDVPIGRWFRLGGLGRLSGLAPDQINAPHAALVTLSTYRRLNDVKLFPAFLGGTVEAGNVWRTRDEIGFDDLRYAGSLFIGAESPIGPMFLGVGYADGGDTAAYLYIGNPWKSAAFQ